MHKTHEWRIWRSIYYQLPIQLPVVDSAADSEGDLERLSEWNLLELKYKWMLWT